MSSAEKTFYEACAVRDKAFDNVGLAGANLTSERKRLEVALGRFIEAYVEAQSNVVTAYWAMKKPAKVSQAKAARKGKRK
jgi:dihydroxyacetone kinase-like predicted kinase